MRIEITKDCTCEHYLHEIMNYPRPGLDKLKKVFKVGEQYEVDAKWNNLSGEYYRVKGEEFYHDVSTSNCKLIKNG
jgi:hypothetical protein